MLASTVPRAWRATSNRTSYTESTSMPVGITSLFPSSNTVGKLPRKHPDRLPGRHAASSICYDIALNMPKMMETSTLGVGPVNPDGAVVALVVMLAL